MRASGVPTVDIVQDVAPLDAGKPSDPVIEVRAAITADSAAISILISSLAHYRSADLSEPAPEAFTSGFSREAIDRYLLDSRYGYLVAVVDGTLAGVIGIRDRNVIQHFFVAEQWQLRGTARRLWDAACLRDLISLDDGAIAVRSSVYAVPVYERFGFRVMGAMVHERGVMYVPMQLPVAHSPTLGNLRSGSQESEAMLATPFELQPTLVGTLITLRPLKPNDFEALYAAASDPLIWVQHPDPLRYEREAFESRVFRGGIESGGAFAIIDNSDGTIVGTTRFYEWDPAAREVAIGYTFLVRSHWGGPVNREMKQLLLDHAFRWTKTVWLHIGENNKRSRRATEKLGARLSHIEIKGAGAFARPTAFYRIEAEAWQRRG